MSDWLKIIGIVCGTVAVTLKLGSYQKQIKKILRTKKATHVSSSAFLYKMGEYSFSIISLLIYRNYVGIVIAVAGLIMCSRALYVICKNKPKGWRLF